MNQKGTNGGNRHGESAIPKLLATRCGQCGRTFFPAKQVCHHCYTDQGILPAKLSPVGIVYAYTVQRMMTPKWGTNPIVVCYADLEGSGLRVFGRLQCAPEDLRTGMPVELVVEDREPARDGFVYFHFRPKGKASKESQ